VTGQTAGCCLHIGESRQGGGKHIGYHQKRKKR
jgi:hypothetical protein